MYCDEFEVRIQRLLDRRVALTTDQRLRQHAEQCGDCAARLEVYLQLADVVAGLEVPPLDDSFSWRVVQLASASRPSVSPRVPALTEPRMAAAAVLIAASLLAVIVPLLAWKGTSPHPETASLPATSEFDGSQIPTETAEEPLFYTWGGVAVAKVIAEDDWQLLWERLASQLATDKIESLAPLADGIRPIADSLGCAWNELRRTFPLSRDAADQASSEDAAERLSLGAAEPTV